MENEKIINLLKSDDFKSLYSKYKVSSISVFWSVSRENETENSDIDLLVEYKDNSGTFHQHFGLQIDLEDKLGRKVDLATGDSIKPWFLEIIKPDLKLIYKI